MGKRFFLLIITFMTIALIGIVFVQVYWIKNTVGITKERFGADVKFALAKVSEDIKEKEFNDYYKKISTALKEGQRLEIADVKKFIYQRIDTINNEKFVFSQSVVEANYNIPTEFFESDSIKYKEIYSKEEVILQKDKEKGKVVSEIETSSPKEHYVKIGRFDRAEKAYLESQFEAYVSKVPVNKRLSNRELSNRLKIAFEKRGITTDFKYGIYRNDLATSIKSGYFAKSDDDSYSVPMFANTQGQTSYKLYVTFPDENKYIFSTIVKMLILSVLFILLILMVFLGAIYQLIKQKQISEIKTDFINNMTHEFKTPIATINLALDAIKNPKIIKDEIKVKRYVQMIRDENKRMHTQVENVLRISKLEKNQLNIKKDIVDIEEIVNDAITHLELIAKNKGGYIKTHFKTIESELKGNQFHLTNIFVNLLDNAIKYSQKTPEVDVYIQDTEKSIVVSIHDKGVGMNKAVQKNIFKKFYREEGGNIHNVKGHGLGLSYVKKIVEYHNGTVQVESEKNEGSIFTVKLPKT